MSRAITGIQSGSVTASLQFSATADQTPIAHVSESGEGPDKNSWTTAAHDVVIDDARALAGQLDLDRQGFAFMRHPTAVQDFYDDDEVVRVYYPEMEALVRSITGAGKAIIFDHTIRIDDEEKQARLKVRAPVKGVHNDFTTGSAPQRVRDLLPADEAEARLEKRYGSINVWRPIRGPVETKPLVICGYGSIDDGDWVAAERHYPDGRVGGIYYLVHNPKQRWYYFPRMEREEVVLLKCFDSLTDGTARWTAHGSFDDPNSPPGATPRESIEIRSLMFFD
ncbi:MAG: CmcJ/NvfI family oxidoreductase [Rhodospirillales bacterium]|nr:CmcJ/NvfI family oxidoreductase [Rhodospirillales bacterium]